MILQQTKILTNRYQPEYFSMALDDRGYPHLSWVEQKNGHFDLVYKFWNGLCWETLETEVLYRSDDEVSYSNIMIVDNEVLIIFTKKSNDNSVIGFIRIDQVVTEIIEYQTNGFIDWVGLITDKTEKKRPYVISYEDSSFKIYQLTDENLIPKTSIEYEVSDPDQIKIATTKDNFIISINNIDNIEFNFFNYLTLSWANVDFIELTSSITTGEITSFDLDGLNNSAQAGFTWIENNNSEKLHYLTTDSSGTETILDLDPIYNKETSLDAPEGFTIGGFTNVGLSYESDTEPHIVALGTQNVKFTYTTEWEQDILGAPTKSESTVFVFNSFNIATISGDQIYFFEVTDQPIVAQETNISLLNSKEFGSANWSSGSLNVSILSGLDNYDNEVGDLLRDLKSPIIVTASNEHPAFGSSSSESSLTSESSQSISSQSESESSSEGFTSDSSLSDSSISDSSISESSVSSQSDSSLSDSSISESSQSDSSLSDSSQSDSSQSDSSQSDSSLSDSSQSDSSQSDSSQSDSSQSDSSQSDSSQSDSSQSVLDSSSSSGGAGKSFFGLTWTNGETKTLDGTLTQPAGGCGGASACRSYWNFPGINIHASASYSSTYIAGITMAETGTENPFNIRLGYTNFGGFSTVSYTTKSNISTQWITWNQLTPGLPIKSNQWNGNFTITSGETISWVQSGNDIDMTISW